MRRHVGTWSLLAGALIPAALAAQQARPDVLYNSQRDSASARHRWERAQVDLPQMSLWSPQSERFDQWDYAHVFFSVDRDAYVALFEVGTDGRVRIIYPRTPRDALLQRGGTTQRVLAGAGFYPDSPMSRQIPYVFAIASYKPFDLSEFGNGKRWRYQLTSSSANARNPEHTIRSIATMMFDEEDPEITADYLYFATRSQVRQAYALRALDACSGSGWNSLSFSDIGTDIFFRQIFLPIWELYLPFGSFANNMLLGGPRNCGRARSWTYASSTGGPALPGQPTSPADSVIPGRTPTRTDSISGPRGQLPGRAGEPRRPKAENSEPGTGVARMAPPVPVMAEDMGIHTTATPVAEPLRERRDRQFESERRRATRSEIMTEARRGNAEGNRAPERRAARAEPERRAESSPAGAPSSSPAPAPPSASSTPSAAPAERPAPRERTPSREAKDPS